jgi:hypothetical protein
MALAEGWVFGWRKSELPKEGPETSINVHIFLKIIYNFNIYFINK